MENIDKYKSLFLGYKVDDLQTMCLKLDINIMNDNDKEKQNKNCMIIYCCNLLKVKN